MRGVLLQISLLGLAAIAFLCVNGSDEDAGAAASLDKDTFDDYLAKHQETHRLCLVMFHVDWCKVCQRVFPKFAAASTMVLEKGIPLDFAQVDCTNDKTLCQRFDVKGYPTIKFFPGKADAEPSNFKSQRTEEGFVKYAERMTKPAVGFFPDAASFEEAIAGELFSSFLVVGNSAEDAPASFKDTAERWRDRHVFAVVPSFEAVLPAALAASLPSDASVVVYSPAKQQWAGASSDASARGAVASLSGNLADTETVSKWVERAKFPGVWVLNEATFFEFTHSGRQAAMVAVDPSNVSKEDEAILRGTASALGDKYIFGVLDGVAWSEELADFNIKKAELPRVLVTVDDLQGWYEDVDGLRLDSLEKDLQDLHSGEKDLLRQGKSVWQRLQLYQREAIRYGQHLYAYAQRGPREAALAGAAVAGGLAAIMTAGWCQVACCRVLMSEDGSEPWDRYQGHAKRE
mmetsp:Transcript_87248/g.182606  ORF Transcript_87248/g.182606 Transcript_87248/m.182606 type:complete len:460 (-) Transcript_87248:46-1425(-)|eukprot:CAMPEP_0206454872 /NCGR_PEP_ID=MMETSP0324_2-20121206/21403_1 /ASSEMBLY_ACC=CAM_ASM_000836 /TAXON_ID=2866 /ORGANISM="Crypthecodinium cohnii, Strain Seligo" /LENGTH=459 /DNA_ID=CAMNT_0053925443 /DNA_START=176 /DNA_END=1555 /DNA_ORIENTATION=+